MNEQPAPTHAPSLVMTTRGRLSGLPLEVGVTPRLAYTVKDARLVVMNLYAIGCGDFIKIGLSADVATRLASLQTGSPILLSVLHQLPVDPERALTVERHAHWLLRDCHERGEWFRVDLATAREVMVRSVREAAEVKAPVGLVLSRRAGTLDAEYEAWLREPDDLTVWPFEDGEDGSL